LTCAFEHKDTFNVIALFIKCQELETRQGQWVEKNLHTY